MRDDELPDVVTIDEAYRAAYFLIQIYGDVEKWQSPDIALLHQYMRSDPARADDWKQAVRMALADSHGVTSDDD